MPSPTLKPWSLCALMHLSHYSNLPLKPLGTNRAAENGPSTPKSTFGKTISQWGLSTNSLKPRELTTPEKAPFQHVNRLLERQNHRAESQRNTLPGLTPNLHHQRRKLPANNRPKVNKEPTKTKVETGKLRRTKTRTQRSKSRFLTWIFRLSSYSV